MSEFATVKIVLEGAVALVVMNRPDSLNAFDAQLRAELLAAINRINADSVVRIAILTGEGRAFCAGADLSEAIPEGFSVIEQLNDEYKPILMAITNAPKPWIAAVNGAAAGIGSAFAMNCDLTVMAEDAYLYQAFTAIGLIPDGGVTWHLARSIGRKRAYELMVSGEKLRADRCLELGLCNRVVPVERLRDEALNWARELADKAPLSLRYAKNALNQSMEISIADAISHEAELQQICVDSEDSKEGVQAFMEKRPASFTGR